MPYDAGGNYAKPIGSDAVDGEDIFAATHNIPIDDISAALNQVVLRSGAAPMTGDFRMGNNRITGLAAATAAGQAVTLEQVPSLSGGGTFLAPITVNINTSQASALTLHSNKDDPFDGPRLSLVREPAVAENNNVGGEIDFVGKQQSTGGLVNYAAERVIFNDVYAVTGTLQWGLAAVGNFYWKLGLNYGALYPIANFGLDLGGASNRWGTAYIQSLNMSGTAYFPRVEIDGSPGAGAAILYLTKRDAGSTGTNHYVLVVIDPTHGGVCGSITMVTSAAFPFQASATWNGYVVSPSDRRLKEDIVSLDPDEALAALRLTRPVTYSRGGADREAGFIAQELAEVMPDAVTPGDGEPGDEAFRPWGLKLGSLEPRVIAALLGMAAKIEALEQRVAALGG